MVFGVSLPLISKGKTKFLQKDQDEWIVKITIFWNPFGTHKNYQILLIFQSPLYSGASRETRTPDPLITNQLSLGYQHQWSSDLNSLKYKPIDSFVAKCPN